MCSSTGSKRSVKHTLVLVSILVAVLAIGIWAAFSHMPKGPQTIVIDGKPIVRLKSHADVKFVLHSLTTEAADGLPYRFHQSVKLSSTPKDAQLSDIQDALDKVRENVNVEVQAFVIFVDNRPIAALESENDAQNSLGLVKRYYANKLRLPVKSTFKESVNISKDYVDSKLFFRSPEDAVKTMTTPIVEPLMHTVQRGDRAEKLAAQYDISLEELKNLNPGVNLEQLTEGDQLLIKRPITGITVVSKGLVTRTKEITMQGENRYSRTRTGKRTTQSVAVFENGEQVSEDIISQVTTWDRPQRRFGGHGRYRRHRTSRDSSE